MDHQDRILNLARGGPLQPTSLAKILNTNSLFASAMLSEVSSKGLLFISHLKIGSSPLYYSPEHPEHLLNYMDRLHDKEKKVALLLKENSVLRENDLEPIQRVCIRNIKDFARPLEVSLGESKEIFWKWFLLSDQEAGNVIKQMLNLEKKPADHVEEKVPQPEPLPGPEPLPELEKLKQETKKIKPVKPRTTKKPRAKTKKIEKKIEDSVQETIKPPMIDTGDSFLKKINSFFDKNNIIIHEVNTIKKKLEFDLIIEIPSPVGNLFYFCKAKNKKRISNSDLSNAYVQGQLKKLPVILLSPGDLTKPAKNFMKDLKGLTVKQL